MFSFLNFIYIFIYILSNSAIFTVQAGYPGASIQRFVVVSSQSTAGRQMASKRWFVPHQIYLIIYHSGTINRQKWLVWHLDVWSIGGKKANNTSKLHSVPQQGFDHCFHKESKWSSYQSLMIFCIRWIFNNGFIQNTNKCHCYSYLQLRDFSPAQAE